MSLPPSQKAHTLETTLISDTDHLNCPANNPNIETIIIPSSEPQLRTNVDGDDMETVENCMFSLTNSTLSLKSLDFYLVSNSRQPRQEKNNARAARLAIVSGSILTISSSIIELSPWTSAIVISPSTIEESGAESSVVVLKCSISSEKGQLRGVVETFAFPSFESSVSVSLVDCSFSSHKILGKDGIGLSLTRSPRKGEKVTGIISSSLIGCSFVNMSSIGSSRQPRLPNLNQMMLGCVVSLTSSHFSGSTIRDMNNGGSVLCSNSSFSSLLSSPNTDTNEPSFITTPGDTPPFVDGDAYSYTSTDGDSSSSISFSHCHFTSPNYASNVRPLTFDDYPGSIALLSCSFTGAARPDDHPDYDPDCPEESGGGAFISSASTPHTTHVKVESCNFTDCSAPKCGGGLFISTTAIVTVTGCRCVGCSVTKNENRVAGGGMFIKLSSTPGSTVSDLSFEWCTSSSYAGGLSVEDVESTHHITTLSFKECSVSSATYLVATSHLKFEDCSASENGGGLAFVSSRGPLSLTDCEFLRCRVTNPDSHFSRGGGLSADSSESTLTVKNCKFIDCSSTTLGAAMIGVAGRFELSDCLVRNCSSKTSGAVCIIPYYGCHSPIALKNVLFVGNTVSDTPTYFDDEEAMKDAVQFADFLIEDEFNESPTEVTISDCWTTTTPNTAGMYSSEYDPETLFLTYTRVELTAFHEVGPYLTQKVEAVVDVESWTVEVIVKGRVPLESQIYEMTVTEEEGGAKMTGQVRFRDGIGSLLPSSSLNLQFSTTYTITSIVGLVPSSSSTTTANGITLTAEAWAFNLNSNPAFVSFTTPDAPAETSIVVVAGGGSDSIDECGGEDLPCRTVWTGQMVGKGKGGEWIRMLVRGEAEMGEGFWIGGNVRMTLSSESATQRSRIVIGRSSLSSMDGIVSISSSTVEVSDLKVIVPSSEEHPSSGWVFVVDSEGTLEASSIGVSGNGEIGIGLAKVKSGSSRFASISISSGSSFGVGVVMGEGKWSTISMLICDFVVRDTTTSNSPLICFSSLSPDSTFSMEGSRFQKTHRLVGSSSSSSPDGNGDSLIEVSTAQPTTEIFKCVFEWSGVADRSGTITRSALRVTLNSSSSSSCSLVISSCLFLDSHPSSSLSGSLHIRVVSGHTTIVFRESWFEETTPTHPWTQNETRIACLDWTRKRVETLSTSVNGALIEYSNEIPIVVRRRGMFSNCKLIMSQKS